MIFSFADLIAYVTTFMTLKPGDIISTGTPVKNDAEGRSAGLAQARRHHRDRVSGDRRAAQFRRGRSVTTTMRAACVIGWPVEHSRSPLIHNYWLKDYGIAGEYRRELVPRKNSRRSFDRSRRAGMSAPTSRCRTRKPLWLTRSPTIGRAPSVRSTRCGSTAMCCARPIPMSKGFLDNLDVCAPHWDRDVGKAVVLGAGGAAAR